jgi:hypothetical protein
VGPAGTGFFSVETYTESGTIDITAIDRVILDAPSLSGFQLTGDPSNGQVLWLTNLSSGIAFLTSSSNREFVLDGNSAAGAVILSGGCAYNMVYNSNYQNWYGGKL